MESRSIPLPSWPFPPPPISTSVSNGQQLTGPVHDGQQRGFDQARCSIPKTPVDSVWRQPYAHTDSVLPPAGNSIMGRAASGGLLGLAQPNPSVPMSTPGSTGHFMLLAGNNNTWVNQSNHSATNPPALFRDQLGYCSLCGRSTNSEALTTVTIDRIVGASKVYCDKWVHTGTCAFTQLGCRFKHEMPSDTATQHKMGLFTGYPPWWKRYQRYQAQRERERGQVEPVPSQW